MSIYSIGHDIVENKRIDLLYQNYGQQFIDKLLSVSEKEIFITKKEPVKFLAKRFAAKEAFAKACGTGLRSPILMPQISIYNNDLGKPYFFLDQIIINYLANLGVCYWHLSISDEINLSSAFVVLEKNT